MCFYVKYYHFWLGHVYTAVTQLCTTMCLCQLIRIAEMQNGHDFSLPQYNLRSSSLRAGEWCTIFIVNTQSSKIQLEEWRQCWSSRTLITGSIPGWLDHHFCLPASARYQIFHHRCVCYNWVLYRIGHFALPKAWAKMILSLPRGGNDD